MKFKERFLELEFNGQRINRKLRFMVNAIDNFCQYHFDNEITITHIIRNQEQQDSFYANDPVYQRKSWKSVHQYGRGVDLRSYDFTDDEIAKLCEFVNQVFPYGDGIHKACICHNVGRGKHIHVQIKA